MVFYLGAVQRRVDWEEKVWAHQESNLEPTD